MTSEPIWVVAGALKGPGDAWLMHRRPYGKHHGGLWEFPGGKVEHAEIPVKALIRELREELGVSIQQEHCVPVGFAEETGTDGSRPIVILLYKITVWGGEPQALEGGAIEWCSPKRIEMLEKPPLDSLLAAQLFERKG
ncbi:MAG: (deoxy)nucleoside triphosphate pyrophosphohydrolase [Pseudomonadota bacterium]